MGTGMVVNSSKPTFLIQLSVIRDLSQLLHAARHGTEALVYIDYLGEAEASMCLAIILGRIASGVPPLNSGANAAPVSMHAVMLAVVEAQITGNR